MTSDTILFPILFVFIVVMIIQAAERFFYAEQAKRKEDKLLEENSRLVKAVISKNAQDYVMTTSIDKVAPEEKPPVEPDLIPEESLNDEEFFDSIGKQLKDKK